MSMTAAEIAGVVGTKYKPWFPSLVYSDSDVNYPHYIDEATGRRVSDDIAELAFGMAAEEELRKRHHHYATISFNGGVDIHAAWAGGNHEKLGTGVTKLHALVAALNESEGA